MERFILDHTFIFGIEKEVKSSKIYSGFLPDMRIYTSEQSRISFFTNCSIHHIWIDFQRNFQLEWICKFDILKVALQKRRWLYLHWVPWELISFYNARRITSSKTVGNHMVLSTSYLKLAECRCLMHTRFRKMPKKNLDHFDYLHFHQIP